MFKFVYGRAWISKLFLGLLAFAFIIGTAIMWGPGGLNFGGGNYIIKVGDIVITPKEYLLELNRLQNSYGSKFSKEQIKKEALNNLLITAIFAYLGERDGFYISQEEIKNFIKTQFSDKHGKFHLKLFEEYLKMLKLTPEEFERIIKTTLLANKYKTAIYSTTYANKPTVEVFLLPFTLKLNVEIMKLSYKRFLNKIKPNNEELKKFYDSIKQNLAVETPPKVKVFLAKTPEEAKQLIGKLKKGENIKPLYTIPLEGNSKKIPQNVSVLIEKVKRSKSIAVIRSKSGFFVGVYKKGKKKIPSYDAVKDRVLEIFKKVKTVEWMHSHIEELAAQVLAGKYKGKIEKGEVLAFNLMEEFHLSLEDLFRILGGKTILKVPTPDGIAVIKVRLVKWDRNISPQVEKTYELSVRNGFYLKKLQEVLNYIYKTGEVKIKINENLLNRI